MVGSGNAAISEIREKQFLERFDSELWCTVFWDANCYSSRCVGPVYPWQSSEVSEGLRSRLPHVRSNLSNHTQLVDYIPGIRCIFGTMTPVGVLGPTRWWNPGVQFTWRWRNSGEPYLEGYQRKKLSIQFTSSMTRIPYQLCRSSSERQPYIQDHWTS
jgi:hypothetical protein